MGITVICNTVLNAIISFINSHIYTFVNAEGTQGANHMCNLLLLYTLLETTGSGIDCTYNMHSTARDLSFSDIFSLTDRQPAVFSSPV